MSQRSEAEEHLRVIRSLMEKATIYRAISAPAALIGGLIGVAGTVALCVTFPTSQSGDSSDLCFRIVWLTAMVLAAISNLFFLWGAANGRGEALFSAGMRLALIAMAPGLICAAFFTTIFWGEGFSNFYLPPIWMLCYGVSLLATSHFAPRSIIVLGWCFLLSGFVSSCFLFVWHWWGQTVTSGNLLMGATFGLYHLVYAVCTWPRQATISAEGE